MRNTSSLIGRDEAIWTFHQVYPTVVSLSTGDQAFVWIQWWFSSFWINLFSWSGHQVLATNRYYV